MPEPGGRRSARGKWVRPGAAALIATVAVQGCAAGPQTGAERPTSGLARVTELLVPSGHGSLLQDDVTLTLRTEELVLKVTPLEEWVLRLTAPDTWSRLSSLAAVHRDEVTRQTGVEDASLFLVSFFSLTPGASFRPQDVQIENRSRLMRPLLIRPLTAGWGQERLEQEEAQLAVYAFSERVDLEQAFAVEYAFQVSSGWEEILRMLELERGRAIARAGLGPI